MTSRTKSVKSEEHGRSVIGTLQRDPATGRLLPRVPKTPASPPAGEPPAGSPAPPAPEVGAPAPTPFRGRALARHRQRSGS